MTEEQPVDAEASIVGVVALVPERWGPRWMSRHHVLTRLSRYFPVVWVNPAHERRSVWGVAGNERFQCPIASLPQFTVYTPPLFLPKLFRPRWLGRRTEYLRLRQADRYLKRCGCRKIVLYVWRPSFSQAPDLLPHDMLLYHVVDEYTFSEVDLPTPPEEVSLLSRADLVLTHTKALMEKKGPYAERSEMVPLGVDFDAFANERDVPTDLEKIPHPRIGYVGSLKKQLDWPLLRELITRRPDWNFVFVGPASPHPEMEESLAFVRSSDNAHLLGPKPSRDVGPYVHHLDIGILPYELTDYALYGSPLKLHEYLAAGIPVVGVPMPALIPFRDVITLARGTDQWESAIAKNLGKEQRSATVVEQRRAVAREYDWNVLVGRIARLIADAPALD